MSDAEISQILWQKDAIQHSLEQYPLEACGFITKAGEFIRLENVHEDKVNHFTISHEDFITFEDDIRFIFHSHCNSVNVSKDDLHYQSLSCVPWVMLNTDGTNPGKFIYFGDNIIHNNYMGLPFIHGAQDCYSLIRDYYYHERGVLLPNYARDNEWWLSGTSKLYDECFKLANFEVVDMSGDLSEGDVLMMRIGRTSCINHASIYVGDGRIVHHIQGRFSLKESYGSYAAKIERVVRFDNNSEFHAKFKEDAKSVKLV